MPHRQRHRGKHPRDDALFDQARLPDLKCATADLSYLLTRGYNDSAALKLVGDHYQLHARQRVAVSRAACSDQARERRKAHQIQPGKAKGQNVAIDAYNTLITIETALSGGILIRGRDGCIRDIAGIHGSYRKVEETLPALRLAGKCLSRLGAHRALWLIDAPVSNSGNLARLLRQEAAANAWQWEAEVVADPDRALKESNEIVVTSDSAILDHAEKWLNLMQTLLEKTEKPATIIDTANPPPECTRGIFPR